MTAAAELGALLETLEREGTSVVALACGAERPQPWRLYPGEYGVFDQSTRSQFYFHDHGDRDEAGHFHTVRLFSDRTAHLAAIAIGRDGWPRELFTLNLWAIGDAFETAENLKRSVRRFLVGESRGEPRLVRFINLVFAAYRAEIEQLQEEKMRILEAHRLAHPRRDPFEDRSLEILSRATIDPRRQAGRSRVEAGA